MAGRSTEAKWDQEALKEAQTRHMNVGVRHRQRQPTMWRTSTCASVVPMSFWMTRRSPARVAVVPSPG